MLKNLLLISSVAFLLSACGPVEKLKVFSSPVENKIISPSDPKPLLLDKLHFDVVNKDNLQKFLKELQKEQNTEEFVFYAITPKTYELLSKYIKPLANKNPNSIIGLSIFNFVSPMFDKCLSFVVASVALDINSLKKIS